MFPLLKTLSIAAGQHSLHIKVYNQGVVPTIFVWGKPLGWTKLIIEMTSIIL
jgi:hypothetical protein